MQGYQRHNLTIQFNYQHIFNFIIEHNIKETFQIKAIEKGDNIKEEAPNLEGIEVYQNKDFLEI